MRLVRLVKTLHDSVFDLLQRLLGDWFLGLAARFVFAAVLLVYFWTSALTKIGPGPFGFLFLSPGAYAQIVPPVFEAAGYNAGNVAVFPWKAIVYAGSWAEFVLPALIVVGLFTRAAALGMIVFVVVQSYVDKVFHDVDAETFGAWFDKVSGAPILDQRALWVFLLAYLALRGAGAVSLDRLLGARSPA